MRTVFRVAIIISVLIAVALAQKPKTVDEAVQVLRTKWLKPKDQDWILRNAKDTVVWTLYRPFGTGVRNQFGLWGDNQSLRISCGNNNPEGCSGVIFNRLWESVRADADPALVRQLDCQFQLAHTIHINEKGFYGLTIRELVKKLQLQIDEQSKQIATTDTRPCQSSLTLDVAGKPDMSCFIYAPHGKNVADRITNVPLDSALIGLGLQNMFITVHNPPKLTLDFYRKCQFPRTPPSP